VKGLFLWGKIRIKKYKLRITLLNISKNELLNTLSHGFGALLACFGLFLLLYHGNNTIEYTLFSIIVYGLSLISMFTVSTLYHAVTDSRIKSKLRILDHINIYFLIAGTYTPFTLLVLIDGAGLTIFFGVWIIAFLGTIFKLFYTGKYEFISLLFYIAMGWLILIDYSSLSKQLNINGIYLLFLGGLFYTLGIVFYVIEKYNYNHFIWHLFVLFGAISHWFCVYYYII
jgi:hemolysin III